MFSKKYQIEAVQYCWTINHFCCLHLVQGSPRVHVSSLNRRTIWPCTSCHQERKPRNTPPVTFTASPNASLPSPTSSHCLYETPHPVSLSYLWFNIEYCTALFIWNTILFLCIYIKWPNPYYYHLYYYSSTVVDIHFHVPHLQAFLNIFH